MNVAQITQALAAIVSAGEANVADPVVLVSARDHVDAGPVDLGEVIVDVQPCVWNERTGDTCSIDDVDLGPGYVKAVALLAKGAS